MSYLLSNKVDPNSTHQKVVNSAWVAIPFAYSEHHLFRSLLMRNVFIPSLWTAQSFVAEIGKRSLFDTAMSTHTMSSIFSLVQMSSSSQLSNWELRSVDPNKNAFWILKSQISYSFSQLLTFGGAWTCLAQQKKLSILRKVYSSLPLKTKQPQRSLSS